VRKRELRERCQRLEAQVRERGLATEAELAEYRPAPRAPDEFAWIYWYAQLVRFCGRLEQRELVSAEADGLIIAALRADPQEVKLSDGATLGGLGGWLLERLLIGWPALEPHRAVLEEILRTTPAALPVPSVWVYPKSFEALLNVHARDQLIAWLAARYALCRQAINGADVMALLERVAAELAYQQGLMVWSALTPGHGLPFALTDDRPALPELVRSLGPWDLVRVHQAFIEVNASRLQALEKLIQPMRDEQGGGRPSWSVFIGTMALKWRTDPVRLMRDHALIQLLATAKIAALTGAGAEELEEEVTG